MFKQWDFNGRYVLDNDGQPVPEPDLLTWGMWMETATNRVLAQDKLDDGTMVSTVFLGLNHAFMPDVLPVLWETMIFGGPHDQEMWRYTSRDDALAGHADALLVAHDFVGEPE